MLQVSLIAVIVMIALVIDHKVANTSDNQDQNHENLQRLKQVSMPYNLLSVVLFITRQHRLPVQLLTRRQPLLPHEKYVNQTLTIDERYANRFHN